MKQFGISKTKYAKLKEALMIQTENQVRTDRQYLRRCEVPVADSQDSVTPFVRHWVKLAI